MWTTRAKVVLRKVLPYSIRKRLRPLERMVDFRVKKNRESPTDYVAEFDHRDVNKARESILWHDDWDKATEATMQICQELRLCEDGSTVIDYGCGIGRISKALVESFPLGKVVAVDRSAEMRRHAVDYLPERYISAGKIELMSDEELLASLGRYKGQVATLMFIEVLHHIPEPVLDDLLPKLLDTLSSNGRLFVFGNERLDVDAQGNTSAKRIEEFLLKHVEILSKDVRSEAQLDGSNWQFRRPRYMFLCAARK